MAFLAIFKSSEKFKSSINSIFSLIVSFRWFLSDRVNIDTNSSFDFKKGAW